MGIFKRFKASVDVSREENTVQWKVLTRMDQLDQILEQSMEKPVGIFKHSTRCGVSRGVLKVFEKDFSLSEDQIILYFLDLLAHRDISNEIVSRFHVHHESPQLIVLKEGKVIYSDSHNAIDASDMQKLL